MSDRTLVTPHGGTLVDRLVPESEAAAFAARAASLPTLPLDAREQADLELIATGAASPLTGFLGRADYQSVLDRMRLADGTVWPLPFTLAVDEATKVAVGEERGLVDANGRLWGTITITDVFTRDPLAESRAVYGTDDAAHPGVAYLLGRPKQLVGGSVRVLPLGDDRPFRTTASRRGSCARRSRRSAGAAWPASRRATRFTARTSTSRSSRSK